MSAIALSFEQLREAIFRGILESLHRKSYSDLHTAVVSGKDPRQIVLPRPEDAMYMGNYGTLSLNFNIPDEYPLSLNIGFTMGRISYSVQVESYLCERTGVRHGLVDLGAELGLRCDWRQMRKVERFEFSDDRNVVSTEDTLNILQTHQLETAFKEFIILQIDRLVIGIASLLADAGVHKEIPPGIFAICVVNSGNSEEQVEAQLRENFTIFARDTRDSSHVVYGLVSVKDDAKPILTCGTAESRLRKAGIECTFRPTFKFTSIDDECSGVQTPKLEVEPPPESPKELTRLPGSQSSRRQDYMEPAIPVVWETEKTAR